jgi:hypothetical protein
MVFREWWSVDGWVCGTVTNLINPIVASSWLFHVIVYSQNGWGRW